MLTNLEKACDPATFGLDHRSVLDASYRNAGKLDKSQFSVNLDLEAAGLLDTVRTGLFLGKDENVLVHAELYKLNVYGALCPNLCGYRLSYLLHEGEGSFFKAHQDTPRGEAMFGSLVLIFPTPHTGGAITIRQGDLERSIDTAQLLSSHDDASPRVAYVAFFSDVEHAVAEVTSGHRVTVTYNLYFANSRNNESLAPSVDVVVPRSFSKPEVKSIISGLLNDQAFLPEGGTLGFGLRHLYPLPTRFHSHDDATLERLEQLLKGTDSALFRACIDLFLTPSLYAIYEDGGDGHASGSGERPLVACPRIVKFDTHDYDEEQPLWEKLCAHFHGVLVNPASVPAGVDVESRHVHWITPLSHVNRVKTHFAAYGNEPMMGYLYQRVCILVSVGPPGRR